jgi:hypothetical protein
MYTFNHQFSPLAALLILAALASAIVARRMRYGAPGIWWSLTVLCALSGFLMFPVSAPIWRVLPEGRFVQFPWRWCFVLCTAAAFLLAYAAIRSNRKRIVWPALALILFAIDATIVYPRHVYPQYVSQIQEKFQSRRGYGGLLEYTPLPSRGRTLPEGAPLIAPVDRQPEESGGKGRAIYAEVWSPEKKVIDAALPQPTALNLKLLAYPAWQATINATPAALTQNPDTGQLMVWLPAGPSRTEIIFTRTWDRTAGLAISIGTSVALIAFWQFVALSRKRAAAPAELEVAPARAA